MAGLAEQLLGTGLINPVDPGIFLNAPAPGTLDGNVTPPAITSVSPSAFSESPFSLLTQANSFISSFGNSLFGGGSFSDAMNAGTLGAVKNAAGAADSFWTDIFLRGVIIILGFIFTAIGLSMFGNKAATVVINETKRSFGK